MEVVSKPCQDQLLHPILVHYRKKEKIQAAKLGTPKKILKKYLSLWTDVTKI